MQVRLEQLDAHLAKAGAQLAPIYVLHGDEHLLVLEAADRIRAAARAAGYAEREVLHAERYFKWGALTASSQSMSLFGDRKLIDLRIPGGKPGRDGSLALQEFAAGAAANAAEVITLVTLPRLDRDGVSSAWFSALAAAGVAIEVPLVGLARLPDWIAARLARQKQQVDRATLAFLVERVEGNLLAAHQEVEKLGLLFPPGPLDGEAVRAAVLNASRYDVYKLRDALLEGQLGRYARILTGLRGEGEALPLVLWAISDGLHRALAAGAPALRRNRLLAALKKTADVDRVAKGLRAPDSTGDAWDDLLALGLLLGR